MKRPRDRGGGYTTVTHESRARKYRENPRTLEQIVAEADECRGPAARAERLHLVASLVESGEWDMTYPEPGLIASLEDAWGVSASTVRKLAVEVRWQLSIHPETRAVVAANLLSKISRVEEIAEEAFDMAKLEDKAAASSAAMAGAGKLLLSAVGQEARLYGFAAGRGPDPDDSDDDDEEGDPGVVEVDATTCPGCLAKVAAMSFCGSCGTRLGGAFIEGDENGKEHS